MADKKVPSAKSGGNSKIPPPKKTYTEPDKEPRSAQTQAAADRHLHGKPTNPDGSVKDGGR